MARCQQRAAEKVFLTVGAFRGRCCCYCLHKCSRAIKEGSQSDQNSRHSSGSREENIPLDSRAPSRHCCCQSKFNQGLKNKKQESHGTAQDLMASEDLGLRQSDRLTIKKKKKPIFGKKPQCFRSRYLDFCSQSFGRLHQEVKTLHHLGCRSIGSPAQNTKILHNVHTQPPCTFLNDGLYKADITTTTYNDKMEFSP